MKILRGIHEWKWKWMTNTVNFHSSNGSLSGLGCRGLAWLDFETADEQGIESSARVRALNAANLPTFLLNYFNSHHHHQHQHHSKHQSEIKQWLANYNCAAQWWWWWWCAFWSVHLIQSHHILGSRYSIWKWCTLYVHRVCCGGRSKNWLT